ncbi:REP-associated tyrosine transposase [Edaphobacter albus]|uniref:REP-associated tyrosine transposase n=1 Tax=Edaphobacter sp. 4G125 TaxID=2763071 RepID=UPI001647E1C4|nr:transposase [Edaphobacter sp. 4G125]QNI37806.1 transposase [Edaphobacter sp. 4G125]
MAIPSRTAKPGTYFITTATHNRRRLFQVESNAELLLETIDHYRASYLLHAYVVMPDHVHLLITPTDITIERTMQLIKGGFSHGMSSKLPVWQRGFTDHRIRDVDDYVIRLNYLHQNPVEARLSDTPETYPFSSANPKLRLDEYLSG